MALTIADQPRSLLLPALLLAGLLATIGSQAGLVHFPTTVQRPMTVTILPRPYSYRAPGDFMRGTVVVDGPLLAVPDPVPLEIMQYQVSAAEYGLCVADGGCRKAEPRRRGHGNVAVTGVSFADATDYARWLSDRTGETWRLPSVGEWAFAAGSKARDHALDRATDENDPAQRWLAYYRRDAALAANAPATPQPLGSFGANEYGLFDLAEAVWEWTATCGSRTILGPAGEILSHLDSCGVRLLEGRHRTPISTFVRDAQGGGCSAGAPPDNLGFRLVRERPWWARLLDDAARIFGA